MKHHALLLIILLASPTLAQDKQKRIGEIEFFGYSSAGSNNSRLDFTKIKAALPLHEGDEFDFDTSFDRENKIRQAVKALTGQAPTEIAKICCDDRGEWIIFIGLSGKAIRYNPAPRAKTRLPPHALKLYDRDMEAIIADVQKGAGAEDPSKGYALSESPALRSIQLEMRAYALANAALLRQVLETSADDKQRIAAAQLLGYARQSPSQIAALVRAHRDSNDTVRNNATRALIVLAESNPKVATQIPATDFIAPLLSGTWTDLNKGSYLIDSLTKARNKKLLAQLHRKEVLDRLIEMARWRVRHASAARYILGRLAGIDEARLQQLVTAGKVDEIIIELHQR